MKFKIGDKVRVTHATNHESVWCHFMDQAIGNEYEIIGLQNLYGNNYYLYPFNGGRCYFPEDSLELAKPPVHTYKEWYALAKEKNIRGRSKMNKEQLVQAVREYKEPILPLGDELRKEVGKQQSCCHFAKEFENGKRAYHVNSPCHAALVYGENCAVLVDDIGYVQQPPIYKDFVHYMLNESPFKDQFLTKDVEKAIQHGVYYDVDKEYNRVVCSAVALRQGNEHAYRLSAFKYFKEKGFSANVSWCLAQPITLIDGKFGLDTMGGGHDVFTRDMATDSFFKFFKEGFWNPVIYSYRNRKEGYALFSAITPGEMERYARKHNKQTILEFVAKEIPFQHVGNGFNVKRVYKEEDILAFANKVKALLE